MGRTWSIHHKDASGVRNRSHHSGDCLMQNSTNSMLCLCYACSNHPPVFDPARHFCALLCEVLVKVGHLDHVHMGEQIAHTPPRVGIQTLHQVERGGDVETQACTSEGMGSVRNEKRTADGQIRDRGRQTDRNDSKKCEKKNAPDKHGA